MLYVYYKYGDPYCGFSGGSHGKMFRTDRRSQRDGGLRVYYACRCDGCSNSSLEYDKPKGMKKEEFEKLVEEAEEKALIKKEERKKKKEEKERIEREKPIIGNLQSALREARLA
jgi:hypothetical protein|tara:strand:- start:249 stop:590 length:342 start_codon:yes stop_codon:yes gene_type:complete